MGGKQAKERRRLKRLEQLEGNDNSNQHGASEKNSFGISNNVHESFSTHSSIPQQPAIKQIDANEESMKISIENNNENSKHGKNTNRKKNIRYNDQCHERKPYKTNKRNPNNSDNNNNNNSGNKNKSKIPHKRGNVNIKNKPKKPKHLKRKLEHAIKENNLKEKEKVEQLISKLQQDKEVRNKFFEKQVKKLTGESFNEELFHKLMKKGASKQTILKSMETNGSMLSLTNNDFDKIIKNDTSTADPDLKTLSKSEEKNDIHMNEFTLSKEKTEETEIYKDDNHKKTVTMEIENATDYDDTNTTRSETQKDDDSNTDKAIPISRSSLSLPEKNKNNDSIIKSDDSSSDDEFHITTMNKRIRGKKRKNLKEADQKRAELNEIQQKAIDSKKKQLEKKSEVENDPESKSKDDNKTRRCIGRKPVTDFEIGKKYKGKVIYIKPFGVFIDIMCHSDAFCHVSRVQDDFVEDIDQVLKVDQEVHPRVLEIDRKKRRITVSLQSEKMIEDEMSSARERKERVEKRKLEKEEMKKTKRKKKDQHAMDHIVDNENQGSSISQDKIVSSLKRNAFEPQSNEGAGGEHDHSMNKSTVEEGTNNLLILDSMDESQLSRTQLKQLRKLRRRADRRMQQESVEAAS